MASQVAKIVPETMIKKLPIDSGYEPQPSPDVMPPRPADYLMTLAEAAHKIRHLEKNPPNG